jgi:hypothetical protein
MSNSWRIVVDGTLAPNPHIYRPSDPKCSSGARRLTVVIHSTFGGLAIRGPAPSTRARAFDHGACVQTTKPTR